MNKLAPRQPNELQQVIDTAERELQNAGQTPFTPKAFSHLKDRISEYAALLITESVKVARRHKSETVSTTHVEHASEYLVSSTSSKVYRHAGTFGGILLGVAGSNFLSMYTTGQFTPNGVVVTVIGTLLGGILTAAHMVKE
jgi:histone H3/H4